ncbi:hypothetical protein AVHY2522_12125 [Acidovorax sp. SUPP2522]|nr:hypothetical protein AVHY2522_12125 [Acidovorax sp. SUPP2522]
MAGLLHGQRHRSRRRLHPCLREGLAGNGLKEQRHPKAALSISILTEAQLRHAWATWFNAQRDRHDATDRDTRFALVRFATDGIWLSALSDIDMPDRLELRDRLLEAAKP